MGAMGSVLKSTINELSPNREEDGFDQEHIAAITEKFANYDMSNIDGLKTALRESGADTSHEQALLTFLGSGTPLAQDIEKQYMHRIASEMKSVVPDFL